MTDPHTLWAVAQLVPGEGIESGVSRIAALLAEALDCKTCAHCFGRAGASSCNSICTCTDGNMYQPLPPVRLWRREP